jgi:hypothetical protein
MPPLVFKSQSTGIYPFADCSLLSQAGIVQEESNLLPNPHLLRGNGFPENDISASLSTSKVTETGKMPQNRFFRK